MSMLYKQGSVRYSARTKEKQRRLTHGTRSLTGASGWDTATGRVSVQEPSGSVLVIWICVGGGAGAPWARR